MSSDSELGLGPLLVLRWRKLALGAAFGLVAGVVYATVAPKWYEATLTVVQSQHGQDAAAMSIAAKMPIALDAFTTDVQRIRAVLVSNSVTDEVIDKFKLGDRYGTEYREQTRKELWQHCNADVDRKSGVVTLKCEDKDPVLAQAMAAYFGEVGNRVFGRVSASSAREERTFLESQVEVARKDVENSSQKLREFQEKYKVIDLPEQSKAVISAMASIKGDMISKQLELSYLSSFSSRGEASVVQLQQQISILEGKLEQLEATERDAAAAAAPKGSGSGAGSGSAEFFPGAMAVPELRFELEGLLREQKIRETVFSLLTQRYEMAKVDEARDTSTFQILDHPTLPTTYSHPRRRKTGLLGLFGGIAVGCAWIVLPIWWRRYSAAARAHNSLES
jgi:tyrosine-protein kinase Etk/Wzc